jgi:hypothetical protein
MRASRFTAEQMTGILKESETGMPTGEVCRCKAKFGGMSRTGVFQRF